MEGWGRQIIYKGNHHSKVITGRGRENMGTGTQCKACEACFTGDSCTTGTYQLMAIRKAVKLPDLQPCQAHQLGGMLGEDGVASWGHQYCLETGPLKYHLS